ncbi:MAG: hypothetical protein ACOH2V_02370 [Candidatus Saccharimonadaceae bacterium]
MYSILKILVDQRCQVYCDYELKGEATPNSLFKIELRKGTYILEFKIGEGVLTREYNMQDVYEENLLKISLKDMSCIDDYCIKVIDSEQYLYNTKLNEIIDLPYKEYKGITDSEHLNTIVYATLLNNEWGAIKYNGKELIAPQFKSLYKLLFEKYLCFEKCEDKFQIYTLQGNLLYSINGFGDLYNHLNYIVFKDHLGKHAIYDDKLKPRTQHVYDNIESFGEKDGCYFKVLKDGYWGIIQLSETPSKNIIILPCKLQEIESCFPGFSVEKYVQVKYDGIYYYLDEKGQVKENPIEDNNKQNHFVFTKKNIFHKKSINLRLNIW